MAEFRIIVTVDPTRAVRGTQRVNRALNRTASTAQRAQSSLRGVFATLGGALVLQQSVSTLASFGQAMSTVRAITEATGDVFEELREKARDLGATTRFTATQAAEGMLFLARAGFDVNEILGTVEGTLQLAQAGALDLGRAADIASNILKAFRLEVDQTGRVVDALAKAANSANTTVEQLGFAAKFVAPVAAGLKVPLETVIAALGVLSDNGLQATLAGTGLRKILSKLEKETPATTKVLLGLGLATDDVRISQVGLIGALERLRDAGITTGDALQLFGDRGGPAFEVLNSSIPSIIELEEKLLKAGGTAECVSKIMDDNLNGSLLRVKSAFEAVVISLGDAGGESGLRGLLDRTASLLRLVADNADTLAIALGALAVVITVKLVQGAIVLLIGGLRSLGVAVLALSARLLPLLAATAATAFTALAVAATISGRTLEEVFGDVKDVLGGLVGDILEPVDAIDAFDERIGVFNRSIKDMGGFSSLTEDQIEDLTEGIKSLRDEVKSRLLLQEFLAPSSEGVEVLAGQVEVLELALTKLKGVAKAPVKIDIEETDTGRPNRLDPEFKLILDQLKREAQGLREVGREREILEKILEVEIGLKREFTTVEEGLLRAVLGENLALRDQQEILEDLRAPAEEYGLALVALAKLERDGKITVEELTRARRRARVELLETQTDTVSGFERAFLKMGEEVEDFATLAERSLTDAFRGAEDALVGFVTTGKLSFRDLADSIIRDLARMAIRASVTKPLFDFFGGVFDNVLNPATPPIIPSTAGTSTSTEAFPSFTHGADFIVGGRPGVDANAVRFNATKGERVRVTPEGQSGGGVVVQVIDQRGSQAAPVERRERTNASGIKTISLIIRDVVRRQVSTGELDQSLQARFGLNPALR